MAINLVDFPYEVEKGLRANKDYNRFFYRFKIDGKTKRGVLDYSNKQWDKRTRISKAKSDVLANKDKIIDTGVNFNENTKLNEIADIYFELACSKTQWNKELHDIYNLYCNNNIGKKRIRDVRQVDIDKLRSSMEKKGHSKQTINGCSPRTIKKVLVQSLKPIMQYALDNKVIKDIPTIKAPKQTRKKKIVDNAGNTLASLYKSIIILYKDNAFYRALFLFALYGRRWNEIRTLEWRDVDSLNNTYTIRPENNKLGIEQTYDLPTPIAHAILEIKDNKLGLIFKSPITNKELHPPKVQLLKLKEHANIPKLTMHYFRHILVSAMGEMGTATTVLSASLGHTNLDTVNQFYMSANHHKASQTANIAIEDITQSKQ